MKECYENISSYENLNLSFIFSYAAFFQKQAAQSTEAHYAIASCAVRFTIALFASLALATNAVKRQEKPARRRFLFSFAQRRLCETRHCCRR